MRLIPYVFHILDAIYIRSRCVQDEVFPENDLRLECASRSKAMVDNGK